MAMVAKLFSVTRFVVALDDENNLFVWSRLFLLTLDRYFVDLLWFIIACQKG